MKLLNPPQNPLNFGIQDASKKFFTCTLEVFYLQASGCIIKIRSSMQAAGNASFFPPNTIIHA